MERILLILSPSLLSKWIIDSCKNLNLSFTIGQEGNFGTAFCEDNIGHESWKEIRVGDAYLTLIIYGNHNEVQKYTISPFPINITHPLA